MDKSVCVIGLSYGDEGKGSIVDYLVREHRADLVVRFNGGAQAAHHVVLDDGRSHCFAQWGSGTLAGARTHLSKYVLIDPRTMRTEAEHLTELGVGDPYGCLTVDPQCVVVTTYHKMMNQLREQMRGDLRHGSCGMGIGEAVADAERNPSMTIRAEDFYAPVRLRLKVEALEGLKREEMDRKGWDVPMRWPSSAAVTRDLIYGALPTLSEDAIALQRTAGTVVFEGAQGVLLDQDHGFAPYHTWSNCTFQNASELVPGDVPIKRVGVIRGYGTRHGAGPFPGEDPALRPLGHEHNTDGEWQGAFRVGHFDRLMLGYALEVTGGVDTLAVTNLDRLPRLHEVVAYDITDLEDAQRQDAFGTDMAYLIDLKRTPKADGLKAARPIFGPSMTPHQFIDTIAARYKRQLLLSWGPRWQDKTAMVWA